MGLAPIVYVFVFVSVFKFASEHAHSQEGVADEKALPMCNDHVAIPSPLSLPLFSILGMHDTHTSNVFPKPLGLGIELCGMS